MLSKKLSPNKASSNKASPKKSPNKVSPKKSPNKASHITDDQYQEIFKKLREYRYAMALYFLIQDIILNKDDKTKNEKYYNKFLEKELINNKGLLYYSKDITNFKNKIKKLMFLKNENKLNTLSLEEKQTELYNKLIYHKDIFFEESLELEKIYRLQ